MTTHITKAISIILTIPVGTGKRYLGLHLDSPWSFEPHFRLLVLQLERAAAAICRLLSNLGGPEEKVRRLYVCVVRLMALYGVPIWADDLVARRRSREALGRIQHLPSGSSEDTARCPAWRRPPWQVYHHSSSWR
ncbi:hypothetical protein WH47_05390 [Habropoda laboriosa]|uniref:Reverse transcriptase n=1 Tax=Habropoda laboriosa TaxID=597456 RepID=A0A0L7QJC6_9HYME|nr:hypothetical protein WH47_05390 [Habropoda laboriosa]